MDVVNTARLLLLGLSTLHNAVDQFLKKNITVKQFTDINIPELNQPISVCGQADGIPSCYPFCSSHQIEGAAYVERCGYYAGNLIPVFVKLTHRRITSVLCYSKAEHRLLC